MIKFGKSNLDICVRCNDNVMEYIFPFFPKHDTHSRKKLLQGTSESADQMGNVSSTNAVEFFCAKNDGNDDSVVVAHVTMKRRKIAWLKPSQLTYLR